MDWSAPEPGAKQACDRETLVFRVLYLGPEGATKAHNLRLLQESRATGRSIEVFLLGGVRLLRLRVPGKRRDSLGHRTEFEVLSLPGRAHAPAARRLLFQTVDGIVFLPERNDPAGRATSSAWRGVRKGLQREQRSRVPICVSSYQDCEHPLGARDLAPINKGETHRMITVDGDQLGEVTRVFEVLERQLLDEALENGQDRFRPRRSLRSFSPSLASSQRALWILAGAAITAMTVVAWRIVLVL